MRKETLVPVRNKRDFSVYFRQKPTHWPALSETGAIVLLIAIALIASPVNKSLSHQLRHLQQFNYLATDSAMTAAGFKVPLLHHPDRSNRQDILAVRETAHLKRS